MTVHPTAVARVEEAQLAASEALIDLVSLKQALSVYQATGNTDALSDALSLAMKIDDNVSGRSSLFRHVQLAERQARRG